MTKHDSHFGFQEKIRALEVELQNVGQSKILLEKELQEVITMTSQELEESREKVLELEDEVTPVLLSLELLCAKHCSLALTWSLCDCGWTRLFPVL